MRLRQLIKEVNISERVSDPDADPALMTWDEYWKFKNPKNKFHNSNAYNWDMDNMNEGFMPSYLRYMSQIAYTQNGVELRYRSGTKNFKLISKDGGLLGYYFDGEYYTLKQNWNSDVASMVRGFYGDVPPVKFVKYLEPLVHTMYAEEIKEEYPELVQNLRVGGKSFQVRKGKHGEQYSFAILNDQGFIVSIAQDEWGAVLIATAREYRGYGFGEVIGKLYTEAYPTKGSGGTTTAGARMIKQRWEAFVREALEQGVYTQLYRDGKITKQRIDDILSGLSERPNKVGIESNNVDYLKQRGNWAFMNDNPNFIIYHDAIYNEDATDVKDAEKYILAHAMVRDGYSGKPHLYSVDYSDKMTKDMIVLMALSEYPELHLDMEASDFVDDVQDISKTKIVDGKIMLEDKRVGRAMQNFYDAEARKRKSHDRYDEYKNVIIEAAESKWK